MIDTEKMKALAANLRGCGTQVSVDGHSIPVCNEAADAIDTLLAALEAAHAERDELRDLHTAGCREAYSKMGIEDDGEYRWKWVLLGISKLVSDVKELRAALEAAAADKREMIDLLKQIPQTPEQMIDFIGSNFNSMEADGWTDDKFPPEPTGDLYNVKYSLTVHDLLSAFSCHGFEDAVTLSQRQEES